MYPLGAVMWALRVACSGRRATFGNATEIMELLGKEETLRRLRLALVMVEEMDSEHDERLKTTP